MKLLQNRSTGEIGCLVCSFGKTPEKITVVQYIDGKRGSKVWYYGSLAELNEEWKDYEEQEVFYIVEQQGIVGSRFRTGEEYEKKFKQIGNHFGTKEEAEKAVEKLEAITRLKGCGFKFKGWRTVDLGADKYYFVITAESDGAGKGDLDLLFGGEE